MQVMLDISRMGREQLHDYLQEMLPLPAYYGRNLDALYDCLTELPETEITWSHMEQADDSFPQVLRVFRAAARENPALTIHRTEKPAGE